MKAGSTLWLLRHEARLVWRGMSTTSKLWSLALLGVFFVILALAGVPLAMALRELDGELELSRWLVLGVVGAMALIFSLMLSHTLAATTEAFFTRSDLDLLLSSPIPASRVLGARCLALAATTGALWLFLFTPPSLTAAALGQGRLLVLPLLVAGLALLATALGLWLAMGLFAVIGPQRTRTVSQIMGAFIGAAFFLAFQARNFLPDETQDRVNRWGAELARSSAFDPGGPLALPARALSGEPLPVLAMILVPVAAFAFTVSVLGRRFAENAAAANGRAAGGRRAARGGVRRFSSGVVRATVRKELILIGRDPKLMSQVLLRLLYLLPLLAILWRSADDDARAALAGAAAGVTFMTGQLAGSLAWITISTEDAPDLLACSPARPHVLRRAKLMAALLPVGVLLLIPVIGLAWTSPTAGLVAAFACAGAAAGSGLIRLWHAKPAKRAEFNKAENGAGILVNVADLASGAAWGATAYVGVLFGLWGLAPAAVGLALLAALRRPAPKYAYA